MILTYGKSIDGCFVAAFNNNNYTYVCHVTITHESNKIKLKYDNKPIRNGNNLFIALDNKLLPLQQASVDFYNHFCLLMFEHIAFCITVLGITAVCNYKERWIMYPQKIHKKQLEHLKLCGNTTNLRYKHIKMIPEEFDKYIASIEIRVLPNVEQGALYEAVCM